MGVELERRKWFVGDWGYVAGELGAPGIWTGYLYRRDANSAENSLRADSTIAVPRRQGIFYYGGKFDSVGLTRRSLGASNFAPTTMDRLARGSGVGWSQRGV